MLTQSPTNRSDDHGFSLIEVLVVITVLGILATIVVFAMRGASDDAEVAAYSADARTIASAQAAYTAQNGRYADEDELVAAGLLREASQLHDIEIDGNDYRVVRADGELEMADGADPAGAADPDGDTEGDTDDDAATTTTAAPTTTVADRPIRLIDHVIGGGIGGIGDIGGRGGRVPVSPTTVAPTTTAAPTTTVAPSKPTPVANAGMTCSVTLVDAWGNGARAQLELTNGSDRRVTAWSVKIEHKGSGVNLGNSKLITSDSTSSTFSNVRHNGSIPAGTSVKPAEGPVNGTGLVKGQTFPCSVVTPTPSISDVSCSLDLVQVEWGGNGGRVHLTIVNSGDIDVSSWTVRIDTEGTKIGGWNSATTSQTDDSSVTVIEQWGTALIDANTKLPPITGWVTGKVTEGQSFPCKVIELG